MKINRTDGLSGIGGQGREPSIPDVLRDPSIQDLPRNQGKPVDPANIQRGSLLTSLLKLEGDDIMSKVDKVEAGLFLSDDNFEHYIGEIADAFIEDLKGKKPNDLETLEGYTARVQQDLFLKCRDYRERVIRGCKAVQTPIIKDEWAKDEKKKFPPGTIL